MKTFKFFTIFFLTTTVIFSILYFNEKKEIKKINEDIIVRSFFDSIYIDNLKSLNNLLINRIDYQTTINELDNYRLLIPILPDTVMNKLDTLELTLDGIILKYKNDKSQRLVKIN